MCDVLAHRHEGLLADALQGASNSLRRGMSTSASLPDVHLGAPLSPASSSLLSSPQARHSLPLAALQAQLHSSNERAAHYEQLLRQRMQEGRQLEAYKQRVQELETLYRLATSELVRSEEQLAAERLRCQQLEGQAVQVVVLEERLRLANARRQELETLVQQLVAQNEQLQAAAAAVQRQLAESHLSVGSASSAGGSEPGAGRHQGVATMQRAKSASVPLTMHALGSPIAGSPITAPASDNDFAKDQEVWPLARPQQQQLQQQLQQQAQVALQPAASGTLRPLPALHPSTPPAEPWVMARTAPQAVPRCSKSWQGPALLASSLNPSTPWEPFSFASQLSSSALSSSQVSLDTAASQGLEAQEQLYEHATASYQVQGSGLAASLTPADLLPHSVDRADMLGGLVSPLHGRQHGSNHLVHGRRSSRHSVSIRQQQEQQQADKQLQPAAQQQQKRVVTMTVDVAHKEQHDAAVGLVDSLVGDTQGSPGTPARTHQHATLPSVLEHHEQGSNATALPASGATAGSAQHPAANGDASTAALVQQQSSAAELQPCDHAVHGATAAAEQVAAAAEAGAAPELDPATQNARLRSKQDAQPNTCVYVGFLGAWVTEQELAEFFSAYGTLVSVRLLISKKSRRSREQAFVEFASVEEAQRAITWLDSIDYPALVKQMGCGGLVVRFADRKKPAA